MTDRKERREVRVVYQRPRSRKWEQAKGVSTDLDRVLAWVTRDLGEPDGKGVWRDAFGVRYRIQERTVVTETTDWEWRDA